MLTDPAVFTDLVLAIAHHLLIFALAAVLVMELMVVRPEMGPAQIVRVSRFDAFYGALAALVLIVGFGRVFFGLRGSAYYFGNWAFWAKIAAFVIVGLLSIQPTMRIRAWRQALAANPDFRPPAAEALGLRRSIHLEAAVFALVPVFAAIMARNSGG